jgi:hypothetical protein
MFASRARKGRAFSETSRFALWVTIEVAPFETLAECEADRDTMHKDSAPVTPSFNAQCVATDDPSLKEK